MDSVKALFWNATERRLRMVWRLLSGGLIFILILISTQACLGIVGMTMLLTGGDLSAEQLADPVELGNLIGNNPFVITGSTVLALLSALMMVALASRFIDRRPVSELGLRLDLNWFIDLGFGLILGALLMILIFVVEMLLGWVEIRGSFQSGLPGLAFPLAILAPLITFLAVGIYEELLSRGYLLKNLAEGLQLGPLGARGSLILAWVLSSALFGWLHASNPNASFISTFNISLAGLFLLAPAMILSGELAIPIGIHITWNFFQGHVFGFAVSGAQVSQSTFLAIEQSGPESWTGGAFGPEAGLLGLIAILLGGLLTAVYLRWRRGRLGLDLDLSRPPLARSGEAPEAAPPEMEGEMA